MATPTTQAVAAVLKKTGDTAAQVYGGWRAPKVSWAGFKCVQNPRTVSVYYYPLAPGSPATREEKFAEYTELLEAAGFIVTEVDGIRLEVRRL